MYTRAAALPQELVPRLRVAASKVGFDWDRDFAITDNSCPTTRISASEKLVLREQFAGKVALQTEQQLQAQATRSRGNAVNRIKAQKLFSEPWCVVPRMHGRHINPTWRARSIDSSKRRPSATS